MPTSKRQTAAFPAVPASLNVDNTDARGYSHHNTPPPAYPYWKPYLRLPARLSQIWFNRWTILLLIVLYRVLSSVSDIQYDVARAKEEALAACTSVEKMGSAMASMPHYMSAGVNAIAAEGVTHAVHGLMDMLMLTVTGVEEILIFMINMYKSTYFCLITLAITGSLHVAIEMIEKVGDFVNKTIGEITSDMSSSLSTFQSGLNGFLSAVNIPALFGSSKDPPQIDLSSQINSLKTIHIDPTAMDAELTKLNASIPTFEEVQNATDNVLRIPFELAKKAMNDSIANYTFDGSLFDVAPKKALSFCSENNAIESFFDGLFKLITKWKTIAMVIIILLAVIALVVMGYLEIIRWRKTQERAGMLTRTNFDPLDVIYCSIRPTTSRFGIWAGSFFKTEKMQCHVRWFVAYCTTLPALFVLALAISGFIANLFQFIILRAIQAEVPGLASQVGDFADKVVAELNDASSSWAVSANSVIINTNDKVNNDLFGWVNTTTEAVNNTLNVFVDETNKILNETFGGTILYDPIKEVMNCLILFKIAGIEKGLTWVHDNAHIDFPKFRPDVFTIGAAASLAGGNSSDSFLSSPGSVATDDITNAVVKATNHVQEALKASALLNTMILLVFVVNMLIGFCVMLYFMLQRDKTRGEGAGPAFTGDGRPPVSPRTMERSQFDNDIVYTSGALDAHGDADVDEKYGVAHAHSVEAAYHPGHARVSSYGEVQHRKS